MLPLPKVYLPELPYLQSRNAVLHPSPSVCLLVGHVNLRYCCVNCCRLQRLWMYVIRSSQYWWYSKNLFWYSIIKKKALELSCGVFYEDSFQSWSQWRWHLQFGAAEILAGSSRLSGNWKSFRCHHILMGSTKKVWRIKWKRVAFLFCCVYSAW